MCPMKESENQREEIHNDTGITRGTYINGIIEILFIISIVLSIKYPVVLVFSLIVAVAAIVINVRMLKLKK